MYSEYRIWNTLNLLFLIFIPYDFFKIKQNNYKLEELLKYILEILVVSCMQYLRQCLRVTNKYIEAQ